MKFYIFRHGQSTWNVLGRTQGRSNDSVLTETGIKQAENLGRILAGKGIEAIFSSPLNRALQTAQKVSLATDAEIIVDPAFIEVNVGVIEGLDKKEKSDRFGAELDKWYAKGDKYLDFALPGGESKRQVRDRIMAGLRRHAGEGKYRTVAISSHGIMLEQIMLSYGETVDIPNASAILLEYKEDGFINHGFVGEK